MSELHEIVWTYDGGSFRGEAVCHADQRAPCRQHPSCGCEEFVQEQSEDGRYFHTVTIFDGTGEAGDRHWHKDGAYCNECEWLNNSDDLTEMSIQHFEIGRTPIKPVWHDGYYEWEAVLSA